MAVPDGADAAGDAGRPVARRPGPVVAAVGLVALAHLGALLVGGPETPLAGLVALELLSLSVLAVATVRADRSRTAVLPVVVVTGALAALSIVAVERLQTHWRVVGVIGVVIVAAGTALSRYERFVVETVTSRSEGGGSTDE